MKILTLGYKICETAYYDLNIFITIVTFTIYKSIYVSEQKQKQINVYNLFKHEFSRYYECYEFGNKKPNIFIKS